MTICAWGVLDALRAVGTLRRPAPAGTRHGLLPGWHAAGHRRGGAGCAGGISGSQDLPAQSLTLLAAQTDFSEPGELGLFIDESQVGFLDNITRGKGYLTGEQMAGSFQFLHSRDLVWTRRM
ncbi:MAG: poly-beta-hydroxybutyrate polymerase, partial [Rhodoferax sp.]|nr:poly-beta-hydroxybutyrate polymerase [Rhodoferax sp.]